MKGVLSVALYLFIGGAIAGFPYGHMQRECPGFADEEAGLMVAMITIAWPALLGVALTSGDIGETATQCELEAAQRTLGGGQ